MKKAEISFNMVIGGIIGVFIILLIFLNPTFMQWIAEKVPNLIPGYNNSQPPAKIPEIIRYSLNDNTVEYYDGLNWHMLNGEWLADVKVGTKTLTRQGAGWYFQSWYYNPDLRDQSLRETTLPNGVDIITMTGIYESDNTEKTHVGRYTDEMIRAADTITINRNDLLIGYNLQNPYIYDGYTIDRLGARKETQHGIVTENNYVHFRYYKNGWEWTTRYDIPWQRIDRQFSENDFSNSEIKDNEEIQQIINSLYQKDAHIGVFALLLEPSIRHNANVQDASDTSGMIAYVEKTVELPINYENLPDNIFTVGTLVGDDHLYLKFEEGKWRWSWYISTIPSDWRSDYDEDKLRNTYYRNKVKELINANFVQGIDILAEKRPLPEKFQPKRGRLILNKDGTLIVKNLGSENMPDGADAKTHQEFSSTHEQIKQIAIAWRDSIFQHPMIFKYNQEKNCILVKVEKTQANGKTYLVADLLKPVGTC